MKIGDKVKCVKLDTHLKIGSIYTIVKSPPYWEDDKTVICLDIDGCVVPYYKSYFTLVKSKATKKSTITFSDVKTQVELAESFIGREVSLKSNLSVRYHVEEVSVILTDKQAEDSSLLVLKEFKKSGYCVAVVSNGRSFPLVDVVLNKPSKTIKLTKDYNIVIEKDVVTVGCQVIPRSKILEIHKIMESFQ